MASIANKNILKFDKDALLKKANDISDSLKKLKASNIPAPDSDSRTLNDPSKPNPVIPSSIASPPIIPQNGESALQPLASQNPSLMSPPLSPPSENPGTMPQGLPPTQLSTSSPSQTPGSTSSRIIFNDSDNNKTTLEDVEQNFDPITGQPQAQ